MKEQTDKQTDGQDPHCSLLRRLCKICSNLNNQCVL